MDDISVFLERIFEGDKNFDHIVSKNNFFKEKNEEIDWCDLRDFFIEKKNFFIKEELSKNKRYVELLIHPEFTFTSSYFPFNHIPVYQIDEKNKEKYLENNYDSFLNYLREKCNCILKKKFKLIEKLVEERKIFVEKIMINQWIKHIDQMPIDDYDYIDLKLTNELLSKTKHIF